jgi:hypothetical protein
LASPGGASGELSSWINLRRVEDGLGRGPRTAEMVDFA